MVRDFFIHMRRVFIEIVFMFFFHIWRWKEEQEDWSYRNGIYVFLVYKEIIAFKFSAEAEKTWRKTLSLLLSKEEDYLTD